MSSVPPITLAIADREEGMATLRKRLRRLRTHDHGIWVISQSATVLSSAHQKQYPGDRLDTCPQARLETQRTLVVHLQLPADLGS